MTGTVRSGRLGVVDGQSTVQNWVVNRITDPKAFKASNTGGGTARRKGNRDWNGSFTQLLSTPTLMPGEKFTFTGYTNDEDASGSSSVSGSAIVDSVAINWDWAAGGIITATINFSGDGKLTPGTASGTDVTAPTAPTSICTKIEFNINRATPSWTEWEHLATAALTINAANQAYVNSSSCEDVGGKKYAWNKRRPGPIDWTLAVTEQDSDGLPAARDIQEDVELRIWVDPATNYWELAEGHIVDATGLTVDRDTGAIIQRTVNVAMNAYSDVATQLGRIVKPGGSLWWGTAAP